MDAELDTIKRAYRQLARRFHPDLAGPEGAVEMKRINRAYAVLSDAEKRQHYDTVIGGVIDLRKGGFVRPRKRPQAIDPDADLEFSGLRIFSTKGPLRAGLHIHNPLGVTSALSSTYTTQGTLLAAGSLDGKGMLWLLAKDKVRTNIQFAADPSYPIESIRELRISEGGAFLAGWGRNGLHIWDAYNGTCLWSYSLLQRAVSAYYSLDLALQVTADGKRQARIALPLLREDVQAPSAWGVRGSDVISLDLHNQHAPAVDARATQTLIEEGIENRRFWAIRMRALARDAQALTTLSCAQVPGDEHQALIVRRWEMTEKGHKGGKPGKLRSQIVSSLMVGRCEDGTSPYATTPDAATIAFVYRGQKIRLCDIGHGTYSELASGNMGGSSKLAISPDAQWLAVAREDSEINEGVVDLWSISTGQVMQKLYHPWQISALHFAEQQLVVALTDGTIQVWH